MKAVLGNILIYSLSLAKISKFILNKLRKRAIRFLWMGNNIKEGVDLINWERLPMPKSFGGWGLKTIYYFAKSLVAKSIWRGLFFRRKWNDIISAKYLRHGSILDWIRNLGRSVKGSSNVWSNSIHAWKVLMNW